MPRFSINVTGLASLKRKRGLEAELVNHNIQDSFLLHEESSNRKKSKMVEHLYEIIISLVIRTVFKVIVQCLAVSELKPGWLSLPMACCCQPFFGKWVGNRSTNSIMSIGRQFKVISNLNCPGCISAKAKSSYYVHKLKCSRQNLVRLNCILYTFLNQMRIVKSIWHKDELQLQ